MVTLMRNSETENLLAKKIPKFGEICNLYENKIEEDRLEVNPAAKTCKECMEKVI
jgi:RNA polymerase-binding transcription factor DksA